jgi:hypothetical protein
MLLFGDTCSIGSNMFLSLHFLVRKRDTFVICMTSICKACKSSSISVSVKLLSSPFSNYVCCFCDLDVYV